jgi:predicted methyltransferase
MRILLALSLAAALAACAPTGQVASAGPDYAAALNDPRRPAAEVERDAARKATELLAFAQISPGEKVGDYIMGGGYWTRILSNLVGPTGRVYAFQPNEFIAFRPAYDAEQDAAVAGRANVEAVSGPIAAPPFPEQLDTIITVQNFHDLFIEQMPPGTGPTAIASLYAALKPGGTLVVVDHSAPAATGTTRTSATHRIDRQAALDALVKAGFVLEAESDLYADPADPRTASVFDPSIRGKTDQFTLRLRKPA